VDEIGRLSLIWEDLVMVDDCVHTDVAAANQERPRGPNTHMTAFVTDSKHAIAFGLFKKNGTTINGYVQHHFTFQKKSIFLNSYPLNATSTKFDYMVLFM
jgi:hypothetical protein